jgi:hypothetical protein
LGMVMRRITKKGDFYMVEGSSQHFKTIAEASKYVRNHEKAKKKGKTLDGRRFWSEKLQMPFRSTWEIELAEMLTELGIKWEYEPKRFYFRAESESYLPDFFLPEYNCWIEVKGWMDKRSLRRVKLFKKYHGAETAFFLYEKEERKLCLEKPQMVEAFVRIAQEELWRRNRK